jgi:hypothetical protein
MLETAVCGTGVYHAGKSELADTLQALKIRVFDKIEQQVEWDIDEPVDRVIDDLFLVPGRRHAGLR